MAKNATDHQQPTGYQLDSICIKFDKLSFYFIVKLVAWLLVYWWLIDCRSPKNYINIQQSYGLKQDNNYIIWFTYYLKIHHRTVLTLALKLVCPMAAWQGEQHRTFSNVNGICCLLQCLEHRSSIRQCLLPVAASLHNEVRQVEDSGCLSSVDYQAEAYYNKWSQ